MAILDSPKLAKLANRGSHKGLVGCIESAAVSPRRPPAPRCSLTCIASHNLQRPFPAEGKALHGVTGLSKPQQEKQQQTEPIPDAQRAAEIETAACNAQRSLASARPKARLRASGRSTRSRPLGASARIRVSGQDSRVRVTHPVPTIQAAILQCPQQALCLGFNFAMFATSPAGAACHLLSR